MEKVFNRLGDLIGNEREGEIKDDAQVFKLSSSSHTEQALSKMKNQVLG